MFFVEAERPGELRTERLLLRPPRRGDLGPLHEAIEETLSELVLWLPWAHPAHSRGDSRRYLKGARAARLRRASFEYVVADIEEERLAGIVSLHRVDWVRRSAGIGYWVRRSAWGQGIATEAASAIRDLAFHHYGLHRVELHVALGNQASHRVAEKVGFRREGIARGVEYVNGRYVDHVQYGLLRSDVTGSAG